MGRSDQDLPVAISRSRVRLKEKTELPEAMINIGGQRSGCKKFIFVKMGMRIER